MSHDVIGIYNAISAKYGKTADVTEAVKYMRKYFNEARYPSVTIKFTEKLALDFAEYADKVKAYVENNCHATIGDLLERFNKRL